MAKRYFSNFSKSDIAGIPKNVAANLRATSYSGTARSGSKGSKMGNVG